MDAGFAWDIGYGIAVKGGQKEALPAGPKVSQFKKDFLEGFNQAIQDGKWGTHPEYQSK